MSIDTLNKQFQKQISDSEPLVSICIPVYNGEKYIRQAIESVLAQTYTNFELIISDNVSTDNTLNIVESINDDRVIISKNERNLGMVYNFNACVKKAKGKYLKILCCDDLLYPEAIQKEVEAFEKNSNVTVVTGCSNIINSSGKIVMKRQLYKEDRLIDGKKFARKTLIAARNYFGETTVTMFKTKVAQAVKIFNDESVFFGVDWDANLMMAYEGDVYYIAEPIACFRVSDVSTSVQLNKEKDDRTYNTSVALFEKHQKMGVIKLNRLNLCLFKVLTRLYIWARAMVQKHNK